MSETEINESGKVDMKAIRDPIYIDNTEKFIKND